MNSKKIKLLSEALSSDVLFQYAFGKSDAQNSKALSWYFDFALQYCEKHGGVITTPEQDGIVTWVPQSAFPPHSNGDVPAIAAPSLRKMNLHESTPEGIIEKRGTSFAYIWLLAVDKEFRGKGYARRMLEEAMHQLRDRGFEECWLSTENPNNKTFYERNGFSLFKEVESQAKLKTAIYYRKIF